MRTAKHKLTDFSWTRCEFASFCTHGPRDSFSFSSKNSSAKSQNLNDSKASQNVYTASKGQCIMCVWTDWLAKISVNVYWKRLWCISRGGYPFSTGTIWPWWRGWDYGCNFRRFSSNKLRSSYHTRLAWSNQTKSIGFIIIMNVESKNNHCDL